MSSFREMQVNDLRRIELSVAQRWIQPNPASFEERLDSDPERGAKSIPEAESDGIFRPIPCYRKVSLGDFGM